MTTPSTKDAVATRRSRNLFQLKIPRLIPYILILVRFILGPLLFWDAYDGTTGISFLVALSIALLTDIFDGVIARHTGTVSAHLRETDGRTDVWFYAWIAISAWRTRPEIVHNFSTPILLVISFQVLAWVIDLAKYRRFSNYHAYTAKAWGIALFLTTIAWFSYTDVTLWLKVAIVCGIICTLEEIAITLVLPNWTYDVSSIFHAIRIRRNLITTEESSNIH